MGTPVPAIDAFFKVAVTFVIDRLEGGGQIISDTGGLTRWGISKKAHPDVDVANLTRAGAEEIYLRRYWNVVKADFLPTPLNFLVFDAGVNMGNRYAVQLLQRVLQVAEDGVVGAETLAAVRAFKNSSELRAVYNARRVRSYMELARSKPVYQPYLYGWICRVLRVADEAGKWSNA